MHSYEIKDSYSFFIPSISMSSFWVAVKKERLFDFLNMVCRDMKGTIGSRRSRPDHVQLEITVTMKQRSIVREWDGIRKFPEGDFSLESEGNFKLLNPLFQALKETDSWEWFKTCVPGRKVQRRLAIACDKANKSHPYTLSQMTYSIQYLSEVASGSWDDYIQTYLQNASK